LPGEASHSWYEDAVEQTDRPGHVGPAGGKRRMGQLASNNRDAQKDVHTACRLFGPRGNAHDTCAARESTSSRDNWRRGERETLRGERETLRRTVRRAQHSAQTGGERSAQHREASAALSTRRARRSNQWRTGRRTAGA
jgi:hypothetical protein